MYARGPGGVNDFLSGRGSGEVHSTGSSPDLVPDGRWYHIVAEFSVLGAWCLAPRHCNPSAWPGIPR